MGLPTKIKTWQHSVNQTLYNATSSLNQRQPVVGIVNSMIGFGTLPWLVWGSSGSGVGGPNYGNDDGVDRWLNDVNNIVNGDSWMVLENQTNGMQILFHFDNVSYNYQGAVKLSLAGGFGAPGSGGTGTDGTLSTPPTAADETTLHDGQWSNTSAVTYKLHVMHSTDGEVTYVVLCHSGNPPFIMLLGDPATPIAPLTLPIGGAVIVSSGSSGDYDDWNNNAKIKAQIGGTNFSCYMTCEGSNHDMIGEDMGWPDDDTGEWPICPIGLFSAVGTHRGRKASMYDLWWGSGAISTGDTYPGDATNLFAQFGHLIFPWNGSIPEVS